MRVSYCGMDVAETQMSAEERRLTYALRDAFDIAALRGQGKTITRNGVSASFGNHELRVSAGRDFAPGMPFVDALRTLAQPNVHATESLHRAVQHVKPAVKMSYGIKIIDVGD